MQYISLYSEYVQIFISSTLAKNVSFVNDLLPNTFKEDLLA